MITEKYPVCDMTVADDSRFRHVHQGRTYLFCSAKCLAKFQASPADYINWRPLPSPVVKSGVMYTCPMHPETHQTFLATARSAA